MLYKYSSKRIISLLVVILTVGLVVFAIVNSDYGATLIYAQTGVLKVGCEKPGVKLSVSKRDYSIATRLFHSSDNDAEMITVHASYAFSRRTQVKHLSGLKGFVKISSSNEALRFVRLQTSPYLIGLWDTDNANKSIFEVVDHAKLDHILDYGYVTQYGKIPRNYLNDLSISSGYYGVVSSKAFVNQGFTQPEVRQVGSVFEIKRWLIQFRTRIPRSLGNRKVELDNNYVADELQFVKETVTEDGDYNRTILRIVKGEEHPTPVDLFFTSIPAGKTTKEN